MNFESKFFVNYGYFPTYENSRKLSLYNIDKSQYEGLSFQELVEVGTYKLKKAIENNFVTNEKHLVPISGGLDSRCILAALLEYTDARNIETYTFGSPKSLDFDIGNLIAKEVGTKHKSFDLSLYKYSEKSLKEAANQTGFQTLLFYHAPVDLIHSNFISCCSWSGFMGDPLAGSKLLTVPSKNILQAKRMYLIKNLFSEVEFLIPEDKILSYVQCDGEVSSEQLTLDEQIDFENRQFKYIEPHVLMGDFKHKLPFLDKNFCEFMLSVDNKYRVKQFLYESILLSAFPKLFNLPTKNKFGLPLSASKGAVKFRRFYNKLLSFGTNNNLNTNYVDFCGKIRYDDDFQSLVRENIMQLEDKKIFEDSDVVLAEILDKHVSGKCNYTNSLLGLASLNININNK
ncbi:asparagine synthase-related protein [Shewanella algae]|uniref:asparagine synthase-related protein n=1 Tax=Shewanella algae TaxID=38313 RepID=UPI0031F5BAC9